MPGRKGVLRGKRFQSRHSTVTDPAAEVLAALRPLSIVNRVNIGEIRPIRRRATDRRVKASPMSGGLRLAVIGGGAVQDVYVYTDAPEDVRAVLDQLF
jgi:hypothetical protein